MTDDVTIRTHKIISPMVMAASILGLFPYEVKADGKLKLALIPAFYSLIVMTFSMYNLFYIAIWNDFLCSDSTTGMARHSIAGSVYIFHKISEALLFTISFLNSFYIRNKSVQRVQMVFKMNALLSEIEAEIDNNFRNTLISYYLIVILFWMVIFVIDYFVLFVWSSSFNITFVSWIFGNLVIMYNSVLIFQISFFTSLIAEGFITVNEELKKLDTRKCVQKNRIFYGNMSKNKQNTQLWITARKRIFFLITAHEMCVNIIESWVQDGSMILLQIVVTNIIAITGQLYSIAVMIVDLINGEKFNEYVLIHSVYWCIINYTKISAIIAKNVQVMELANRSALIIHEILAREQAIEITTEMTQAITTFLVILVQFKIENKNL